MNWLGLVLGILLLIQGLLQGLALISPGPWRQLYDPKRWAGPSDDPDSRRRSQVVAGIGALADMMIGIGIILYSRGSGAPGPILVGIGIIGWLVYYAQRRRRRQPPEP